MGLKDPSRSLKLMHDWNIIPPLFKTLESCAELETDQIKSCIDEAIDLSFIVEKVLKSDDF